MWWKIYFWISAIVVGWNTLGLVGMLLEWQIRGVLPILISVVYALAVYSYAYNKHIFSQQAWELWMVIVWMVYAFRFGVILPLDNIWNPLTVTLIIFSLIVFSLPAWYCIYSLGFGKKERVKVAAVKTSKKLPAKRRSNELKPRGK